MTDNPVPELLPELRAWLETWKSCLELVLSKMSGQPMAFEISAEPLAEADSDLRYGVSASGAVAGETFVRLSTDAAIRLAHKFIGETPAPADAPAQLSAEHKEAVEELLRQVAGQAASALAARVGGQVQLQVATATAPTPAPNAVCLRTGDEGGAPVVIEFQIAAELVSALQARAQAEVQPAGSPAPVEAADRAVAFDDSAAPCESPSPEAASYQRLMDVGLEVKLRFGRRRMVLRDVLALSTGIVVELENHISAPVDLLLDGRTIAQGEVVVVDGKYGLRVTQVLDPKP